MPPDEPRKRSGTHAKAPDTPPAQPAAKRREDPDIRSAFMVQRERPEDERSRVLSVMILCRGCKRPQTLAPPRFRVDQDGDVTTWDQGAYFRCTTCDRAIGPLRLAGWTFGRLG